MNKASYQLIVTKLDLKIITVKQAKEFAVRFGANPVGRTAEEIIRSLRSQVVG